MQILHNIVRFVLQSKVTDNVDAHGPEPVLFKVLGLEKPQELLDSDLFKIVDLRHVCLHTQCINTFMAE